MKYPENKSNTRDISVLKFNTALNFKDERTLFGSLPPFRDSHKCPIWNNITIKWVSGDYCEGFGRGISAEEEKSGCRWLKICPSYQLHVKENSLAPEKIATFLKETKQGNKEE